MSTVFSGADVDLRHRDMGGDICVVTFTSLSPTPHQEGFGERFFDKRGISAIHFLSKWNHWWQSAEMSDAIAQAKRLIAAHGYRRVIVYGASMGGYGAGLHSAEFAADATLMVAPQFSIDPAKEPSEPRWVKEAARISFINDDMLARLSPTTMGLVVFDPRHELDQRQAVLFAGQANIEFLPIYFGGHMPGRVLLQADLLETLLLQMIAGSYSYGGFRQALRARRGNSQTYWSELAVHAHKNGRKALASAALRKAVELDPKPTSVKKWLNVSQASFARGEYEEALECARQARDLRPDMPAPWRVMARSLSALARHDEAIAAATAAVNLNDADVPLQKTLLDCLMRAQRLVEALPVARKVDKLQPGNPTTLKFLARSLAACGETERALRTANRALKLTPDSPSVQKIVRELEARIERGDIQPKPAYQL
jgi:tetratricopeptide (TPR) repeat protein